MGSPRNSWRRSAWLVASLAVILGAIAPAGAARPTVSGNVAAVAYFDRAAATTNALSGFREVVTGLYWMRDEGSLVGLAEGPSGPLTADMYRATATIWVGRRDSRELWQLAEYRPVCRSGQAACRRQLPIEVYVDTRAAYVRYVGGSAARCYEPSSNSDPTFLSRNQTWAAAGVYFPLGSARSTSGAALVAVSSTHTSPWNSSVSETAYVWKSTHTIDVVTSTSAASPAGPAFRWRRGLVGLAKGFVPDFTGCS